MEVNNLKILINNDISSIAKYYENVVKRRTRELNHEMNERKRIESEHQQKEAFLRTCLEMAPIGIFVANGAYKIIDANAEACHLMGLIKEDILSLSLLDILTPEYLKPTHLEKGIEGFHALTFSGYADGDYCVHKKDHADLWISIRATKLNEDCYLIYCTDISAHKANAVKVDYLYSHDALTGIYNRAFYEEAIQCLDTEENLPFSVILADINGLKLTNDAHGHAEGDRVLIETTKILSEHLRIGDILARVGGDEFSILLPQTNSAEAQEIVNLIQASCQMINFESSEIPVKLSLSLGTATKTKVEESLSYISNAAEDYMYRSKLLERKSFHSTLLESLRVSLFERSHETEEHASRLANLSVKLGTAMDLNQDALNDLALLALLHDIGKMNIDNSILEKPGKLNDEEWIEMKKHPEIGYRIAMSSVELRPIATYILCHHERWDGTGYPHRLNGDDIPLLSRVISIVDAYDAMTNDRSYRKALTKEAAIAEIKNHSGTQFDPAIATLFLTLI